MKVNYNLSTILYIISDPAMTEPGPWRRTHVLDGCSPVLISVSDLLKNWRATHILDGCSPILISGSDLLKHCCTGEVTHILDGCSPVLVSGSDLLEHWRATHSLDGCSPVLVSGSDLLKHWRDSLSGCVFTHSCQWF